MKKTAFLRGELAHGLRLCPRQKIRPPALRSTADQVDVDNGRRHPDATGRLPAASFDRQAPLMNRTRWNRTRGTSAPSARPPTSGRTVRRPRRSTPRAHHGPEILDATGRLPAASFDRQAPLRNRTRWKRTR
jgi:hypothetical protein